MQFCGRRKYLGHFSSSFKAHFLFHTWSLSLLFHKHFGANFVGWFPSVPNLVQARNIFSPDPSCKIMQLWQLVLLNWCWKLRQTQCKWCKCTTWFMHIHPIAQCPSVGGGYHFHTSIIKLSSFPLTGIWNGSGLSVMFPVPTFDQEDTNANIQPFLLNISYIVCVYRSRRRRGEINKQHISLLEGTSVFFISYHFFSNWYLFFLSLEHLKSSHISV